MMVFSASRIEPNGSVTNQLRRYGLTRRDRVRGIKPCISETLPSPVTEEDILNHQEQLAIQFISENDLSNLTKGKKGEVEVNWVSQIRGSLLHKGTTRTRSGTR